VCASASEARLSRSFRSCDRRAGRRSRHPNIARGVEGGVGVMGAEVEGVGLGGGGGVV
jgi:hypothetical protein